ncbi:MAG: prolyl oligopeptidase family serine peptidase [Cyclobacteriaceae bacterium]|nr:prolyl oligopeptidase family serine peptidase [Cyclobacteriaceae bacterium]UYN88196.1 MAG: prolyl oligopeptidase family serine peptidase [Cyclobacteriaceae bacterium]
MTRLFTLIFVFVACPAFTQDLSEFKKYEFQTEQDTLPYRLLFPENAARDKKYPLVIFLHGSGERGNDNEQNLKYITELFLNAANRTKFPAYVAVPQCPVGKRWAPQDWYGKVEEPAALVMALIDSLVKHEPIDASRIYLMGLSMGGFGTWYLVTRFPDTFAAAVPICGGGDWNQAQKISHIPFWVFHGQKDEIVLPEQSRTMVAALKKAGAKPRYTEYKKVGHDSWVPAFKEPQLLPWLFSKSTTTK